ncbi:MAG TPA: MoaD/ThiS family protein [Propionibacterium sp.]|nr:MoaD/ThiS family protein [Propionibacterium sp.]
MTTTVRFFAAAAEAAGTNTTQVDAETLGGLQAALLDAHGPEFERVLARCSTLVDGVRTEDPATPLGPGVVVDILPPFAGG